MFSQRAAQTSAASLLLVSLMMEIPQRDGLCFDCLVMERVTVLTSYYDAGGLCFNFFYKETDSVLTFSCDIHGFCSDFLVAETGCALTFSWLRLNISFPPTYQHQKGDSLHGSHVSPISPTSPPQGESQPQRGVYNFALIGDSQFAILSDKLLHRD